MLAVSGNTIEGQFGMRKEKSVSEGKRSFRPGEAQRRAFIRDFGCSCQMLPRRVNPTEGQRSRKLSVGFHPAEVHLTATNSIQRIHSISFLALRRAPPGRKLRLPCSRMRTRS